MPSGLRSSRLMLSASLSACRLSSVTWPSGSLTRTRSSAGTLPASTPRGAPAPSSSGDSSSSSSGSAGRAEGTSRRPGGRIPGAPGAPRGGGETLLQSSPEVRGPVQGLPAVASSGGETQPRGLHDVLRTHVGRDQPRTPSPGQCPPVRVPQWPRPQPPGLLSSRLRSALFIQSHPPSLPSENRNHQDLP